MGRRLVRRVTVFRVSVEGQRREVTKAQEPGGRQDVGGVSAQLCREPVAQFHGHVGTDLREIRTGKDIP